MPDLVRLQIQEFGICKFKCATIAEAESIAKVGEQTGAALDVLLAYPLVGPNLGRFTELLSRRPKTVFRATVDSLEGVSELSVALASVGGRVPVLLDLDVGMGRTGVEPGEKAVEVFQAISKSPNLVADGVHLYDGHIQDKDRETRTRACDEAFFKAQQTIEMIEARGIRVARIVAGGTPTFPIHSARNLENLECSPGTCIFHDSGYSAKFPDLDFEPAALVLTRVISKPRPGRLCLDVGYKAVAGDPPAPRVEILGLETYELGAQSEEHLVVDTPSAEQLRAGDVLYAIPKHICPTCALYREAEVVEGGVRAARWKVEAHDREISG